MAHAAPEQKMEYGISLSVSEAGGRIKRIYSSNAELRPRERGLTKCNAEPRPREHGLTKGGFTVEWVGGLKESTVMQNLSPPFLVVSRVFRDTRGLRVASVGGSAGELLHLMTTTTNRLFAPAQQRMSDRGIVSQL